MPSLVRSGFSCLYSKDNKNVTFIDYEDVDADTLDEAVLFTFRADTTLEYRNLVFLVLSKNDFSSTPNY
jgi:hypothetical protein